MPITNLAIQRRRLHELNSLICERELELFNLELRSRSISFSEFSNDHVNFRIHGRKLTPQIIQRINDYGFEVIGVKRLNEHTIIIELHKWPTRKEKPMP